MLLRICVTALCLNQFKLLMEGAYKYSIQMKIERGLQSQNLADVLTTITDCAHYIREYPFPGFVHNIFFKLAQAFQGELFGRKFEQSLNIIRLRIVTAIRECSGSLLGVAIPSEDIVRCIMKVSHSNDYKARSMTLLFFASLGRLIFDDIKVHNLVIESLDCTEQTELSAAIQAASELAKHSLPFSVSILRKIAELLGSNRLSHWVRSELMAVVANLKDLSLTKQCLQLEMALLDGSDHKMRPAVYNSLTQLVSRGEQNVAEQISILLRGLYKAILQRDKALISCILLNLSKLSAFSQHWSREHILTLRDFYVQIELLNSKAVLGAWLRCLEVLSTSEKHNKILIEEHKWISLLNDVNVVLRIHAINLALNLVQQNSAANAHFGPLLFDAIIQTLRESQEAALSAVHSSPTPFSDPILGQRFFALISKFVRGPSCTVSLAKCLTENLLSAEREELLSRCLSKFPLELLAVICDVWTECRNFVLSSLVGCVNFSPCTSLAKLPPTFFSLLLAVVPSACYGAEHPFSALIGRMEEIVGKMDHWALYQMARSALRYGHWRRFALPLLQRVQRQTENLETKSWLMALAYVAESQPAAFSTEELQRAETLLQRAALYLKALVSSEKDQPFWFAADYVSSLLSSLKCVRFLLTTVEIELSNGENDAAFCVGTSADERAIIFEELAEVQKSKSFDADTQTLLQMALLIRICLLMEQYLDFLVASKKDRPMLSEIRIEDLGESTQNSIPCFQTRNFFGLICWAREELLAFHGDGTNQRDLKSCLQLLRNLLEQLTGFPLGLPRFFFQRVQFTKIKLSISPQSTDGRGVYRVSSMDLLPVIIEGIIESNNRKAIESVLVVLTLRRDNTAPTEKRQHIQLEQGDNYFKAQFLLKIVHQKATKINAKVYFVDSVTKKQWCDESDMATLTVELADGTH
uniref:Integrator complex subunit 7 n=1 Tax=Globodera rostochiensis TaxID=31243 RepID=A0A914GU08_GLORO